MLRIRFRFAAVLAALTLAGSLASIPAAHAADTDPLGPQLAVPFTSSDRYGLGTTGGPGTDALNDAVAAACRDGAAYAEQQWFRLAPGASGTLRLLPQRLRAIGDYRWEPIGVGAALVDLGTGSVLGCGEPTQVEDTGGLAVVAWAEPEDLRICRLVLPSCALSGLRLLASTTPPPGNDDWQHPTVIDALPYREAVDTTFADDDGPNVLRGCPLSDAWQVSQHATAWWRFTPSVSGDLQIGDLPTGFEYGFAELTADGPVRLDWTTADESELCDLAPPLPPVKAGHDYLIALVRRYNSIEEFPAIAYGAPLTLSIAGTVPSPPRHLSAVPGDGQATVSWTPAENLAGSGVTGYRIRALDDEDAVAATADVPAASSGTITGLTDGRGYRFDVQALRGDVAGTRSLLTDRVVPLADVGEPEGLRVEEDRTASALVLRWDAPASPGAPIVGYRASGGGGEPQDLPASARSFRLPGVAPWTPVPFTLRALSAAGPGPEVGVTGTLTTPTPTAVTSLSTGIARGRIVAGWQAPEHDGDSAVTGYRVAVHAAGDVSATSALPATARSFTLPAVRPGTRVVVDVTPSNAAGDGPTSTTDPVTMVLPPAPVSDVAAPNPVVDSVTLTWTAPPAAANRPVSGYHLDWQALDDSGVGGSTTVDAPETSAQLWLTRAWVPYRVRVVATGPGGDSRAVTTTVTPTGDQPSPPRDVRAVAGDRELTVTWAAPEHEGSSPVDRWAVRVFAADGSWDTAVAWATAYGADARRATVAGLEPGRKYRAAVVAANGGYPSSDPSASSAVVMVATTPGAPVVRRARAVDGAVTVSWQPPKDNGFSPITGYVVTLQRLDDDGSVAEALPQPLVAGSVRTLEVPADPGRYVAIVHAVNALGAGEDSDPSRVVIVAS